MEPSSTPGDVKDWREVRLMKARKIVMRAWPLLIFGAAFAAYLLMHDGGTLPAGLGNYMDGTPIGDGTQHTPP
jgi:hypothetical protein